MRILTDTNVLISAFLFPASIPARCLKLAADAHTLVLCGYIISETREVLRKKWPDTLGKLDSFFTNIPHCLISDVANVSARIADQKDLPILSAAVAGKVDVLVSGDRHFLELNLRGKPQIMTPREFYEFCQVQNRR